MAYPTPNVIQPYWGFNLYTPALPQFYWNVKSAEQRIHHICKELHKIAEYSNYLGENINLDHETIEQLENDFEQFKETGFLDYYQEQIETWIREHFVDVMKSIINTGVFFGLTEDGYFCANVVWQLAIFFDTIVDYSSDDYGRLVLNY